MFSFHKPKVYRSATGCCICKAKSSSSRFTDSKKYEDDFVKCFLLEEHRTGEICNACVLLVKRWKKLPAGSSRNWRHVVDARAGPGIKSLTKFKGKNKKRALDEPEKIEKILKKKQFYSNSDAEHERSPDIGDERAEEYLDGGGKRASSPGSPDESDDIGPIKKTSRKDSEVNDFIDLTYFKRKTVCCGIVFIGMYGEVLVDPQFIKPCVSLAAHRQQSHLSAVINSQASPSHSSSSASASPCHSSASASPAHSVESASSTVSASSSKGKSFSDCSSDSGYEDTSQQPESQASKLVSVLTSASVTLKNNSIEIKQNREILDRETVAN